MVGRSRKKPKVIIVDHEMYPLPEQENLLNYKVQGGLEVDQVTDCKKRAAKFLSMLKFN